MKLSRTGSKHPPPLTEPARNIYTNTFSSSTTTHNLKTQMEEVRKQDQKVSCAVFSQQDSLNYEGRFSHVSSLAFVNPSAKVCRHR